MNTNILFTNLLSNASYFTKVFGNITKNDFSNIEEQVLIESIGYLYQKYRKQPTIDEVRLFLDTANTLPNNVRKITIEKIDDIAKSDTYIDPDILIDSTENYIKNVRTEQMLERGIKILEGGSKDSIEAIQQDMKEISQLSFQSSMGHDYFEDAEKRFLEYGTMEDTTVPSGIELLDIAGWARKSTCSLILASSNAGKTLNMASFVTNASVNGYNVAVFTMEDGEIAWSSRIDANLMNTTLTEMKDKGVAMKTTFESVITDKFGKIKIKEFPTGAASTNNFKQILQEWRLKDSFIPDIIFCDYLGIMKPTFAVANGYEKGKVVSEELRALAVELKVAVVSAVQSNRGSFEAQYLSMADVSDSIGIVQTADTIIGIVPGGEDAPDKQFMSVLKSRQTDKAKLKPTAVNVSTEHQRVWDISDKRSARVPKAINETISHMNEVVDNIDEMVMNPNADLSDMFNVPVK